MRITYDHQIFSFQEYGGVSRYFVEVARRIQAFDGYDVDVLSPLFINRYLKDDDLLNVRGRYVRKLPKPGRLTQRLNAELVSWMLHRRPPNIVHETYYSKKKLASPKTRTVITVYDMIHEKFPQSFRAIDNTSRLKKAAVQRADHVICISENTRADLIDVLGVNRERTSVIYLGRPTIQASDSQPHTNTKRPYIAYVGARGGYKNFSGVLGAFAASPFLRSDFSIVCFGGGAFTSSEMEEIARSGLATEHVTQVNGGDEGLANLYQNAAAFVYPSRYEGFGLPPLEAMAARCPVVCSKTSSLPEVCGKAAEYFDPDSPELIAGAIEKAVESSRRQELIALGLQQIERFSWDVCAKQTAAVYSALL